MVKEFVLVSIEEYDELNLNKDNSSPFKEDRFLNLDMSEAKDSEKSLCVGILLQFEVKIQLEE